MMATNDDRAMLDAADIDLLGQLLDVYEVLDPMPAHLPELVLFALGMEGLDAEMARLVESEGALVGTRGSAPVEHARRVTFSSDSLTVMVAVEPGTVKDVVRLDGWAAPGGGLEVELRCGDRVFTTSCDEDGRFVFADVAIGPAQLTLRPTTTSDPSIRIPVVTPAINL